MQENFQAMSDDRAVFENVPSTVPQPKSACASCLEVCGGNHWKSCGERVCVMLVGLLKAWGNGYCSCWTTWSLVLGASKCRGGTPILNHTGREICVISLATFTIPVCRWIPSDDNLADEPSRSKRYRPITYSDIDQRGMTAKESTPGSELFAVLSAGAARVAGEEAQSRKLSRVRSCAGVAGLSRGRPEPCPTTTTNSGPRCSGESGLSAPSSASRPSSSGA